MKHIAIYDTNRIVVMDDVKIVDVGSYKELIEKDGYYRKLYQPESLVS